MLASCYGIAYWDVFSSSLLSIAPSLDIKCKLGLGFVPRIVLEKDGRDRYTLGK